MRFFMLIFKSVCRHAARTVATGLALVVLVMVGILISAVLFSLDQFTAEKSKEARMIVKSRWRLPSRMPISYVPLLSRGAAATGEDVLPLDFMAWQFYAGTIDPVNVTPESSVFCIAVEPRKIRSMMEDLEDLDPELVEKMMANKRAVLMGPGQLQALDKRVGERIVVTGLSFFRGLDLEFEIVGQLPEGTYDATIINWDYLNGAFDRYEREHLGFKHPADQERLCLFWLKLADADAFRRVAAQIESCSQLTNPPLECQSPSLDLAARLAVHRDLVWVMRWLLAPTVLAIMALVIVNATGISVRQREKELAVLKVLGFSPRRILLLVVGEAVLVGAVAGLLGGGLTFTLARTFFSGSEFLFVPELIVPFHALAWGPVFGALTALLGSVGPAWTAHSLNVAQVFARVT
jgi:putative ABC transport system permease protein